MNADGSGQRNLTRHPANDFKLSWSPDGRRIAFAGNDGLYLVNADGSGLRRLTRSGETPAWSPDGCRIAFTSGRDGNYDYEIYVMNADGSSQRNLTRIPRPTCLLPGRLTGRRSPLPDAAANRHRTSM